MAEEDDQRFQQTKEREDSAYRGEDIPGDELTIPSDVPQEQMPHPSMAADGIEKASKPVIIKRLLYLVLIILLAAVVGVAAWKLIPAKNDSQHPSQPAQGQAQSSEAADPVSLALGDTHLTQEYKSDTLRLTIKYPQSWKIAEQDNGVSVKSPSFDLTDSMGGTTQAYFKVYIKQGAKDSDGKYLGKGFAVAPSEKLAYSDPAVGQRKSTFLTDFGLENTDNFAYFVVQGNFNLDKGDTLGPKFASEVDSFLVTGGFATDEQKDGLETLVTPIDSYKQNLAYRTGVEIIKSLQLQ